MSNHITPTPGRIVWYRGADGETRPAIVIKGNGPFNADLYVFPMSGADTDWGNKATVTHADPEQEPGCLTSWHWMPYQKQQAEKHATEAARGDEPKVAAMTQCAGQIVGAGTRDDSYVRFQALDMALRTPGVAGFDDVLRAAQEYQQHIAGRPPEPPLAQQQPAPGAAHAGYSTMQPHQQRVVDERTELDDKLSKLAGFFGSSVFATLPSAEQRRLRSQAEAMRTYSGILAERIAAFAPAAA